MSRLYEAVCEVIDNQYYHADENKYSIGDNIIKDYSRGNEYKVDRDIAEVYSRKTGKDIIHIIYMLDHPNEEYKDYNYIYAVKTKDPLRVYMDYSAICCTIFLNDIKELKHSRAEIIDIFSDAYLGDMKAFSILQRYYQYMYSDNIEYIDNNVVVTSIYFDKSKEERF